MMAPFRPSKGASPTVLTKLRIASACAARVFVTENRQFHKFIIITMILTSPHDSAIRWEEVLRVL